ncbi:hypothetical protein Pint_07691 [Pistacia integerrima]|uniref:Uncharacterized protein n=1 Tax=Pistacia integerrima TaxID=434235 RepID=A0ACC0XV83_9ROSI|nr:hypothetical protein Pint_07691 [Pistacia integerrima]
MLCVTVYYWLQKKWLPLHTLAASGEFYLVDALLKHNVDINAVDKDGLTAIHKSIIGKKQAVTNYLLRESANPFVCDDNGATLLHYAVQTASSPAIKILLLYNVDLNLQDNDGWTPLHLAVQARRTDIVKLLLDGWTPLHLAVQARRTDIVKLLLIKGADKTLKNQPSSSIRFSIIQNHLKTEHRTTVCMSDDPSNGELELTSNRQGTSAVEWDVTKQLNPCLWKGINCSGGSLITQPSLSGFGLFDSEFLSVVCNISSLQSLDVSENQFSSIPHEFITDCGRIGSVPHRIVKLAKLEVLILSLKMLDGGIPANFSSISTLSRLAANQNNFTGSIPSGLTRYTVDLSYNSPEGSIPDKMSPSLVRLRLGSNSLNGVIPSANFATLEKLTDLELNNNSLRIGGSIPDSIRNMNSLIELQLGENKLGGKIPSLPVKLQIALNLSSNQLVRIHLWSNSPP